MALLTKPEMCNGVAVAIQRSTSPIIGIDTTALTVAFMGLSLKEVVRLYCNYVDENYRHAEKTWKS
jgi:hypothetical protein